MKWTLQIITCVVVTQLSSSALFAADRGSFLEAGKKQFDSGNYDRAISILSDVVRSAGDANTRNQANYFLGLSLFENEMYFSSLSAFRHVISAGDDRNRDVYEKAIKNAVVIADRLNMLGKVGRSLQKLSSGLVPGSVASHSHYALGVHDMESGDLDSAISHLKSVNPENAYYNKALLYLGILETRKKNYKESVFYFEKVIKLAKGKRDQFDIGDLARLNLARTAYTMGDMERSVELYSQFLASSSYWLTVLLEASWPLMRANDTTVSLGNLHTITSPFYREDLVGEGYILRATILFSMCKYEEMKRTLAQFLKLYDPVIRQMQAAQSSLGGAEGYFRAYQAGASDKNRVLHRAFINYAKRDQGIQKSFKVLNLLKDEKANLAKISRSDSTRGLISGVDEAIRQLEIETGDQLQKIHKRKLAELIDQREQANYLKIEVATGEKDLIEGQGGLPSKRVVDVETTVGSNYQFWPFTGEYWDDELGAYIYTTESACVN